MQSMLTKEVGGACDILIKEQQRIKDYFRRYEEAESDRQKKTIGDECLRAIDVVIALEEELFYPAVRRSIGERQRVVQALAANQVAKLLIKELKTLPGGEQYNARFALLKENLTQHFESEDAEIFPRVDRSSMDLDRLGGEMLQFKARLVHDQSTGFSRQGIVAVAAGVAAIGTAIGTALWLARRGSTSRR